jgi:prolyl 4-hydroxylase
MAENPYISGETDSRVAAANAVLVGGNGRAADPVGATTLYRQAFAAGSGAAAERLAVMAAAGVGRPVHWGEALDRLADAAELGWRPAQGQLLALTGAEGTNWREIRSRLDPKTLVKPPHLERVHDRPAIALVSGLATKAMCDWIIARAAGRVARAKIGDYATGMAVPDPIRTGFASGFGLADTDLIFVLTQERLARASGLAVRQQEAPFVLSYEPGQEYKPHFDFFNPEVKSYARLLEVMGQRVATCLTWLNDDYEGGETSFLEIGWNHRGKTGDAMLFLNVTTPDRKPDPMTLHAGLPVTVGRKWMLSQWVRDRAQLIV